MEKKLRGPHALYRPKRRPVAIKLTDHGFKLLVAGCRATKLGRSDYVEQLIRLVWDNR